MYIYYPGMWGRYCPGSHTHSTSHKDRVHGVTLLIWLGTLLYLHEFRAIFRLVQADGYFGPLSGSYSPALRQCRAVPFCGWSDNLEQTSLRSMASRKLCSQFHQLLKTVLFRLTWVWIYKERYIKFVWLSDWVIDKERKNRMDNKPKIRPTDKPWTQQAVSKTFLLANSDMYSTSNKFLSTNPSAALASCWLCWI